MLDKFIYENIEDLNLSKDMRGWNSDHAVFKHIIDEVKPSVICEVGSWKGASAIHMASVSNAKIYCVDTWLGGIDHWLSSNEQDDIPRRHGYPQMYFQFLTNVKLSGFSDRIVPVPNTSTSGMKYLHKKGIVPQFMYIDASHEADDVAQDVRTARKLFPKCVLLGDDWMWGSVKEGVYSVLAPTKIIDRIFWYFKP